MNYRNCTVKFYLRIVQNPSNLGYPIYCRIIYNRKKSEFTTGEHLTEAKWDKNIGFPKRSPRIKEKLLKIQSDILDYKRKLEYEKKEITSKILRDYYRNGEVEEKVEVIYFSKYYTDEVNKMEQLPNEYSTSTINRYRTTHDRFLLFLKSEGFDDVPINDISLTMIERFHHHLLTTPNTRTGKPMSNNSTDNYHKNLKKVFGTAFRNRIIKRNPYDNFKMRTDKVNREPLTEDELKRFERCKLDDEKLIKVRDIFLFSCYSGLRYGDAQKLRIENIDIDSKGVYWFKFNQSKGNLKRHLPLLKSCIDIYHKYDFEREVTGFVLPQMTNQIINEKLKIIAALADIKMNLTHHIARHTFATTITLDNEMPIEIVSQFLGHTNLKTTKIYAKITANFKLRYADMINKKLEDA